MIEKLEHLINEVRALQSKLVLLIGPPHSGKTALLHTLAQSKGVTPLNVGAELGCRLASMPQKQRHLQTTTILRELADQHATGDLLLLDNIELLFDRSLQLDPLDLRPLTGAVLPLVAESPNGRCGRFAVRNTVAYRQEKWGPEPPFKNLLFPPLSLFKT